MTTSASSTSTLLTLMLLSLFALNFDRAAAAHDSRDDPRGPAGQGDLNLTQNHDEQQQQQPRSSFVGPLRRVFASLHRKVDRRPKAPAGQPLHLDDDDPGSPLFVTPLIDAGKYKEAQAAALVKGLGGPEVTSYSGYFSVGKPGCNSNLFFWFFPSAYAAEKAPVLLWLQGGPGGTSLFGLFNEHGPFVVDKSLNITARKYTWVMSHSVLYIDNPVGTGFSFTGKPDCYATSQTEVADDLYDALLQFFRMFPDMRANDFYVTGESYAGKYVPAISYKIHHEQSKAAKKQPTELINFKGMAIGDGLCDPETMTDYSDFLFNLGLIDEVDRDYFKKVSDDEVTLIRQKKWMQAFQLFDNLMNGDLTGHPSYFSNVTSFNYYFNYLQENQPANMDFFGQLIIKPAVRKAIHVGNSKWNSGEEVEKHLLQDFMQSVKPWVVEIMEHYKVLIYNGQLDIIVAWPLTENFIRSMKWSGSDAYINATRTHWHVSNRLAGYVKTVKNFTQVLVRNAGHMVPYDQPKWAFDMITRFTSGKKFQ